MKHHTKKKRWFEFEGAKIGGPKKVTRRMARVQEHPQKLNFKPTVHKAFSYFVEAITNGASIPDLKRDFRKKAFTRLITDLQTMRPDLMNKLYGMPASHLRLIADECLSYQLTFALHMLGTISSMRVIGPGMKDKHLVPAMSRAGYDAIISLDKHRKNPDNALCEIIKRAHRNKNYALKNKFNMQNFPIVVLLPNDQKRAMRLLHEKHIEILEFLQNPGRDCIFDLSDATPTSERITHQPDVQTHSIESIHFCYA